MKEAGKMIASNIRAERSRTGFTQEQVAAKLGISTKTYIEYEKDAANFKAGALYKLAELLNCKIDDFFIQK